MTTSLSRRVFLAASAASIFPAVAGASALGHPADLLNAVADAPQPATVPDEDWKDAGVIDLSKSPFAKLNARKCSANSFFGSNWPISSVRNVRISRTDWTQ